MEKNSGIVPANCILTYILIHRVKDTTAETTRSPGEEASGTTSPARLTGLTAPLRPDAKLVRTCLQIYFLFTYIGFRWWVRYLAGNLCAWTPTIILNFFFFRKYWSETKWHLWKDWRKNIKGKRLLRRYTLYISQFRI